MCRCVEDYKVSRDGQCIWNQRQADAYSIGSAEAKAAFNLALLAQSRQQLYHAIVHTLVCVVQTAHVKLIYLTFRQALTNNDGFRSVSISCSITVWCQQCCRSLLITKASWDPISAMLDLAMTFNGSPSHETANFYSVSTRWGVNDPFPYKTDLKKRTF